MRRYGTAACQACALKAQCTAPGKERRTSQWQHKAVLETVQDRLDRNSDKMRVRRETVSIPFGTIKAWMGATHFQMRTVAENGDRNGAARTGLQHEARDAILVDFLAKDATIRSNTSVCLEVVDPAITELTRRMPRLPCEITREPARKRKSRL